jgi:hypothetical protein
MTKNDQRTAADMDVVLEEVCRNLPHRGDHAIMKRASTLLKD